MHLPALILWLTNLSSSAKDRILNKLVAIKKITKPFGSSTLAKNALREVKLLRYMRHENVSLPNPRIS